MNEDNQTMCDEIRELAFDRERKAFDADSLSDAQRARYESHLDTCETCRHYADRLSGLLDSARSSDPSEWGEADSDEMFDAIWDEVGAESGGETEVRDDGESGGDAPGDDLPDSPTRSWWQSGLALAAGIAAVLLAGYVIQARFVSDDGTTPQRASSDDTPNESAPTDEPADDESPADDSGSKLANLTPADTPGDAVRLFASRGADWELTGDRSFELKVREGTVLVEFLPREGAELRVLTPDARLQVVGTVFYVTADDSGSNAGVVVGEVEATDRRGDNPVTLRAGDTLGGSGTTASMDASTEHIVGSYVDLEQHRRKLGELKRRDEQDEASKTDGKPSTEQKPSDDHQPAMKQGHEPSTEAEPLDALRKKAQRSVEKHRFAEAAKLYERVLERLPADDTEAADVHLDVARLYMRQLDRPRRAADHLRTFVQRWPDDIAAESARSELCRLADEHGWEEGLCD